MKTKRILAAALCALLAAGWLAGCSTETGGGESRLEDTTINGEEAKDLKYIRPGQNADNENDPVIRAIRAYENLYGVKVDVIAADYDTWTAIYLAYLALLAGDTLPQAVSFFPAGAGATLSAGDRGPSVLVLQLMLGTALPHFADTVPVPLTGEYDADTAAGVRRAQGVFLLPQTGVADRATWEALALFHNSFFGRTPLGWLDKGQ